MSSYDDGENFFIQASWVVESHRDTTLDARCVLTIRFSEAQIQRKRSHALHPESDNLSSANRPPAIQAFS